jgi:hypothetical protein
VQCNARLERKKEEEEDLTVAELPGMAKMQQGAQGLHRKNIRVANNAIHNNQL